MHITTPKKSSPGTLVVIDGGDGAGKATQVRMLVERLRAEGDSVATLDFPQYTQNPFGILLRECLDGKRGDFMSYDARVASLPYALDRFFTKEQIQAWLTAGSVVILDRYITANMLHQGAKIADAATFDEYLAWLEHIEHDILGIPKPAMVLLLNNPRSYRSKLVEQAANEGKNNAGVDVAEKDVAPQRAVDTTITRLLDRNPQWREITCTTHNGILLTP